MKEEAHVIVFDVRFAIVASAKYTLPLYPRKKNTMTERIININERTIQTFVEKNRPPIEIRDKLDLGYCYESNVIELFETRSIWNKIDEFQNLSFAKMKYIKSQKIWKLYWMRASGEWQSYEPFSESNNLEKLFLIINEDVYGCFKG